MNKLIDQLILSAGAWQTNEDPVIAQQFSVLFKELKAVTGFNHEDAIELINNPSKYKEIKNKCRDFIIFKGVKIGYTGSLMDDENVPF